MHINLVKIGREVAKIWSRTDKHTHRQTRSSQYSAPSIGRGVLVMIMLMFEHKNSPRHNACWCQCRYRRCCIHFTATCSGLTRRIHGQFTNTSDHIRSFVFSFSLFHVLVVGSVVGLNYVSFWAHVKLASRTVSYQWTGSGEQNSGQRGLRATECFVRSKGDESWGGKCNKTRPISVDSRLWISIL